MAKSRPFDVIFLSCPRALSNLLVKLLSEQQGWEGAGYHLQDAWIYGLEQFSHSADAKAPPETRKEFVRQLREGFAKLEAAREMANSNSKSARFLDLAAMYRSWRELYGEEVDNAMVKLTESYMPDYEYLKSKKM